MMIALVAAMDQQRVIGRDNLIPWRLKADLLRLKRLTAGQTVILGRKTYDSMAGYYERSGRPMPGRLYVVVTRDKHFKTAGQAVIAHSVDDALTKAAATHSDIYVIGGAELFKQMLPLADRLYITEVKSSVGGDSYFPAIDPEMWRETDRSHHGKDQSNEYDFDFAVYEKIKPNA